MAVLFLYPSFTAAVRAANLELSDLGCEDAEDRNI
jgi:hypothetical protein